MDKIGEEPEKKKKEKIEKIEKIEGLSDLNITLDEASTLNQKLTPTRNKSSIIKKTIGSKESFGSKTSGK